MVSQAAGRVSETKDGWIFIKDLQCPSMSMPKCATPAMGMYPTNSTFMSCCVKMGMTSSVSISIRHVVLVMFPSSSWWCLSSCRHKQGEAVVNAARMECSCDQKEIKSDKVQLPFKCISLVKVKMMGVQALLTSMVMKPSHVSRRLSQRMSNASAASQVRIFCAHSAQSFCPCVGPQLRKMGSSQGMFASTAILQEC